MQSDLSSNVSPEVHTADRLSVPDDHIFPEVKWIGAVIVPVLVAAFVILYLFTDRTGDLFAWNITPQMTPLLMGAGYIGGAYFLVRVVFAKHWHTISAGFLPITVFTWFMLFATLLHLDKFTPNHPAFYLWLILYIITENLESHAHLWAVVRLIKGCS